MPASAERLAASPFVGRAAEIAQLEGALDEVGEQRGALFMLVGEPGIGKSRLADEVARRARARGLAVSWGRCWESGGAPAYWPWVQVLRAHAARLDPPALAERLAAAPDLLHILPELRVRVPSLPELEPIDSEHGRFRILDAAVAFLRGVAADQPLLLLLDDLHAADQSSLLLLRFLARELRSLPLVVVGAYREAEAARDPLIGPILADVVREGQRIPLYGLSAEAVGGYLAAAAPQHARRDTVDAVYAVTEGNPLFLTEVVRLWLAAQARDGGGGRATPPLAIPEELRTAIRQRLGPIPAPVRRLLTLAAVQGREFDLVLVERLADGGDDGAARADVSAALDLARANGILQPLPDAIGRYSFAHVLIRDVLYDELPGAERAQRHRQVAQALETMHAANLAPHLAEIAHHHALAAVDGEVDKAIDFARRAGDRALTMLAYEDAARHYEHALRALELRRQGPQAGDALLRCEVLLALGEAQWGAGELAPMRATFQRAAEAARALPVEQKAPRLARAAIGVGGRQQRAHLVFDDEVARLLEEAREALGSADSPLRARVLARLAYVLYTQPGSLPRRAALCAEAETIARRVADPGTLRWVLNDFRWALWEPDSIEERLRMGGELAELAERNGDSESALNELCWRIVDRLELGDLVAADAALATYTQAARQYRWPWFHWYIGRFEAMRALLQGRFAEAEQHAEQALAAIKRTEHEDALLVYGTQMLAIRTEQGRVAELEAGVQAFVAQYPAVEVWRYVLAYLQAELERPDATRAELERAMRTPAASLPTSYLRITAGAYLAEACAYVGDAERAAPLYEQLRPYAERTVMVGFGIVCRGSLQRHLGLLAETCGRRQQAAGHFAAALAADDRLGARPAAARTRLAHAQMLLAGAADGVERAQAAALLQAAHATAAELGMQSLLPRIAALAERAGAPRAAAAAPVEPRGASAEPSSALAGSFRSEGDVWAIGLGGQIARLRDLRGLTYIAHLLRRPGEEVHVFDLLDLADGTAADRATAPARDGGDAGEMIDASARAAYRSRLRDLREELAEAEADNDLGRIERCREELDLLADHLSAATGLGGRDRRAASQANRARVAVAKAIRVALSRIETQTPDLASHLDLAIKTGTFCSYNPDPLRPMRWDLG